MKPKVAVSQQGQDWEAPQMKDLELLIPEHYTLLSSNTAFLALDILGNYLEKAARNKSTLPPGYRKHFLIHHLSKNHYQNTVNKSIDLKTR